ALLSQKASIIGNTSLYGATGGPLYAAGPAGEPLRVRKSGAINVVEGIRDNRCENNNRGKLCVFGKNRVKIGAGKNGG
ncbi:hypothetical protein ACQWFX_26720, partial [Salmonella enterica subsp. enterica serovar Infantis]